MSYSKFFEEAFEPKPHPYPRALDIHGLFSIEPDLFGGFTDIAKYKEPTRADHIIQNWMRNRNTVEFLGLWESLNNADFKPLEFEGFRSRAGLNSFVLTPRQWIENTAAVGIVSKSGRYGGTFAHKDIAFEFASWISVEFKLYLIKEFQRLKEDENRRLSLAWNLTAPSPKSTTASTPTPFRPTSFPPRSRPGRPPSPTPPKPTSSTSPSSA